jgi:hypothetical protein
MPELARRVAAVDDWDVTLAAAELHALSPLLYSHLRAAQVRVAPQVSRQLQALYVRHRRSNAVRLQALGEIVDALTERGIDARVLKGPALMTLVYRDPALRPASDLDLLVQPTEAMAAQQVLRALGYHAAHTHWPSAPGAHHHLPQASRAIDGLVVQVEIHHNALDRDGGVSLQLDTTREEPVTFEAGGRRVSTLGPHEMLWHLCEHLVGPLPRRLRLILLADVVGWATAFGDALDWQSVREKYPIVMNVLALANRFTPLPDVLASRLLGATPDAFVKTDTDRDEWLSPCDGRRGASRRWHQTHRSLRPPKGWVLVRYGTPDGTVPPGWWLQHLRIANRAGVRRGLRRVLRGRKPLED